MLLFFFFFFNKFIYLFLAVFGLRFCARAFYSCGKRGPLFITVCGPLTIAASLDAEHRLQMRRLSSCGSRAQLLRGMWDLPRPGLEPASPALAGRVSTTAPPGKPPHATLYRYCHFPPFPLLYNFVISRILSRSIYIVLSFQECAINGGIQYVTFWYWLFLLSINSLRSIQAVACISSSFILLLNSSPWNECHSV